MAKGKIRSYRGYKTYLAVVSIPEDAERSLPILQRLRKQGYRLRVKHEKRIKKAQASIDGASAVVVFLSRAACLDARFADETAYAAQLGKKIITIHLDQAALPRGLSMLLNSLQAVPAYDYPDEAAFYEKLLASDALKNLQPTERQRKRKRRLITAIILTIVTLLIAVLVIAAVAVYRILSRFIKPDDSQAAAQTVVAASPAPSATPAPTIRLGTPISQEEIAAIQSLTIIGDRLILAGANVETNAVETFDIADIALFTGLTYVRIMNVEQIDLRPLWELENLEVLSLQNVGAGSLKGMEKLKKLIRLQLSNTDITDLSPLSRCDFSHAEKKNRGFSLLLENNPIADFSPLADVPVYYTLNLDAPYAAYAEYITRCRRIENMTVKHVDSLLELAEQKAVINLTIEDSALPSLEGLAAFPNLETLIASGCGLAQIGSLPDMPKLTRMELADNELSSLEGLSAFPNLTFLNVYNNKGLPDDEARRHSSSALRIAYGKRD